MLVTLAVVIAWVAPPDAVQGQFQKLMYLHVPSAWNAFLCFFTVLISSVWFLRTRSARAWRVAGVAAGVGVALTALTLLSGSIWGSITWGTFWTWDARITSTAGMGLVYAAFLASRALVTTDRGRIGTAILGVMAFATAPIVHFSVIWFRTLHQSATVLAPSVNPPIDSRMLLALATCVAAASMVTAQIVRWRVARSEDTSSSSGAAAYRQPRTTVHT